MVNDMARLVLYVRNRFCPTKTGNSSLVVPLVVVEDMVVLVIAFQDLEQGLLSLGAGPWKYMRTQDRGWKLRRQGEKALGEVWGRNFGGSGLVSSENATDRCGHRPSLLYCWRSGEER